MTDRIEKFTERPWHLEEEAEGGFVIYVKTDDSSWNNLVLCQRASWFHRAAMSKANGRLMVKSPDLYKALDEMTTLFQFALLNTSVELAADGMVYVVKARALLKEARGL